MSEVHEVSGIVYGPLFKWTNYIKGYRYRWFILQNGHLSCYRTQIDSNHSCRTTVSVATAVVMETGPRTFTLTCDKAVYNLRASSTADRDRWMDALRQSVDQTRIGVTDSSGNIIRLTTRDIRTRLVLIQEKRLALQDSLRHVTNVRAQLVPDVEKLSTAAKKQPEVVSLAKTLVDRVQRATDASHSAAQIAGEMVDSILLIDRQLDTLLDVCEKNRLELERMLEVVGKQYQQNRRSRLPDPGLSMDQKLNELNKKLMVDRINDDSDWEDDQDEDVFHDAQDDRGTTLQASIYAKKDVKVSKTGRVDYHSKPTPSNDSTNRAGPRIRRTSIPPKPATNVSLWELLRRAMGSDLQRIALPVGWHKMNHCVDCGGQRHISKALRVVHRCLRNESCKVAYSEPISFLQRITEDLEYSSLLDSVAGNTAVDRCLQLCHVCAFIVSAYAATSERLHRPFTPLLGETFECDRRDDLGWRSIAEKVQHKPDNIVSLYAEGSGWTLRQENAANIQIRLFRNDILINPKGIVHLRFTKTGDHYTWSKSIETHVNNLVVGNLWIDHVGEMTIVNHVTKDTCRLTFPGYRSKQNSRKVSGVVWNSAGVQRYQLSGTWDDSFQISEVVHSARPTSPNKAQKISGTPLVIWRRNIPPQSLNECFHFTLLAVQLNEIEPNVAPTDSRLRPDQRLLETGQYEQADRVKLELEEKQRRVRGQREKAAKKLGHDHPEAQYLPRWFRRSPDPVTGELVHQYTGEYWQCKEKQDWSRCPDIFL